MSIQNNTIITTMLTQTTYSNYLQESTQHQNNLLDNLTITTHNVQGINDKLKLQTWLEYCYRNNYNIISMTETKLADFTNTKF